MTCLETTFIMPEAFTFQLGDLSLSFSLPISKIGVPGWLQGIEATLGRVAFAEGPRASDCERLSLPLPCP